MTFRLAWFAALLGCVAVAASAAEKKKDTAKDTRSPADIDAATRLQVFLDRANFAPGKLDGYYGDFTHKALALYRQSRGEQANPAREGGSRTAPPNIAGLDLASVDPVFVDYTVTDADLQNIGELPTEVSARAKLKALPYRDAAEALAEKFHSDLDFLEKLNPGKMKTLKAGDQLKVPNVEPFELAAVKDLKPGGEAAPRAANDAASDEAANSSETASGEPAAKADAPGVAPVSVKVDTKTNMLALYQGGAIVAAYPVTIGSGQTESPVGDWTVRSVAKMPDYRYDEKMLKEGERSDDFKILPPGPNSPVGIVWIALNKKGIGLHGTEEPDSIGRSVSHGCVRLANWDIIRLAGKVKAGVPVSIH